MIISIKFKLDPAVDAEADQAEALTNATSAFNQANRGRLSESDFCEYLLRKEIASITAAAVAKELKSQSDELMVAPRSKRLAATLASQTELDK